MAMKNAVPPLIRWQDRIVMGDRVIEIPIDGDVVTEDKIRHIKTWLKESIDPYATVYVTMYHGTAATHPIFEQGILPTTKSNRKNSTSEMGYVYLATTPTRAKMFGDLRNESGSVVYEVLVPLKKLLADKNILKSQYLPNNAVGKTLADSICLGGARVKDKIEPWQIKEYIPQNTNFRKVKLTMRKNVKMQDILSDFKERVEYLDYTTDSEKPNYDYEGYEGRLMGVYLNNTLLLIVEESGVFIPNDALVTQENHIEKLKSELKNLLEFYSQTEPLKLKNTTIQDKRIVCEFNDVLLIGKMYLHGDVKYATYEYNADHSEVNGEQYFDTDLDAAKQNFAIRSGLISEKKLFSKEETTVIYQSLVQRVLSNKDISSIEEQELKKLTEKLEVDTLPQEDIQEHEFER